MSITDKLSDEAAAAIIAAIERDDRGTLYALLEQHGLNAYLTHKWTTGGEEEDGFFEEPCHHECSGNAANIAVRLEKEALAVDLIRKGIEVRDTYYSAESALGWSEETNALFENALYFQMRDLTRELMTRSPGVEWNAENRIDCDSWAAGRWSNSLFLRVSQHTETLAFLQEVGLLAGTLNGLPVNISAETGQFRVKLDGQDLGLQPTMALAMNMVAEKAGYAPVDHDANFKAHEAHAAAAMEAMAAEARHSEHGAPPAGPGGAGTVPCTSNRVDNIPW